MSHLVDVYAKDLGVKMGRPFLNPHFFPIVEDKYITIHNDNKIASKEYDFWPYVVELLKKFAPEYKIIQIGSGSEPPISGVHNFIHTSTLKQCAFIIKKASCHIGIDSVPIHIASVFDVPIVGIYAHTYAKTCDPLWNDKSPAFIIESSRDGKKPSFSLKEQDKEINKINPEEIAQKTLNALGINKSIDFKTRFIGKKSNNKCYQVIPSQKITKSIPACIVRMDIDHNEKNLQQIMSHCDVEIVTNRPIDYSLLKNKRIKSILYKSDEFDENFVNNVKESAIKIYLQCTSPDNLKKQRAKFFDLSISLCQDDINIENAKEKCKNFINNDFKFLSSKKTICGNKIYNSFYEFNGAKNINDFYLDLDYCFVYIDSNE